MKESKFPGLHMRQDAEPTGTFNSLFADWTFNLGLDFFFLDLSKTEFGVSHWNLQSFKHMLQVSLKHNVSENFFGSPETGYSWGWNSPGMIVIVCFTGPQSRGAVPSLKPSSVETQKIGMQESLACFGLEGNGDFRSPCPRFGWPWESREERDPC